jgi:hypothetical protein
MFSANILEVNFKNCLISNLFYLRFCFRPHVFAGNSSLRVCGVVPWLGIVRNIILLHTHIILPQHLTNKQLFSSHHTTPLHTWPILKNFLFIRGNWRDRTAGCLTTGCWAVWLQVWHPWLVLKTSLVLIWYRWMPLLFQYHCPVPVQITGLGTGTWLSYAHTSQTAHWGPIIQSGLLLLHSWNKW